MEEGSPRGTPIWEPGAGMQFLDEGVRPLRSGGDVGDAGVMSYGSITVISTNVGGNWLPTFHHDGEPPGWHGSNDRAQSESPYFGGAPCS
jgi:hypothetical protein